MAFHFRPRGVALALFSFGFGKAQDVTLVGFLFELVSGGVYAFVCETSRVI